MEWKEVRLGDVCSKIGSGATPSGGKEAYKGGDYHLIRSQNVLDFAFSKDGLASINDEQANKLKNVEIIQGDVLLNITGDSVARCCIVPSEILPARVNQHVAIIRPRKEELDNHYLLYYLQHYKRQLLQIASAGATRNAITKAMIENLILSCPKSLEDQRRIASILSSLDRKIELNNKINADLEEMAQAIFKNWFVDFEPFKDGKFVNSELGMIPEGWKVGRLDEIADVVGGSTPSKAKPEYYTQKGIAWLTPKDLSNHPAVYSSRGEIDITEEGYNSTSTKLMPKGTVLFTSRAPIGYISIAQNDICTNQGFKSVVPKKAGTCFLYCFLKYVTPEIENKSTGSTFKEASGALMKSLQVIMPEQKVFEDFEEIVCPLFARIESLEKENSRLSLLRDTLLPRLMSGELEVPE